MSSSDLSSPSSCKLDNYRSCVVCGDEVLHWHFKKQICTSCSVYFRRIVTRPQNLKCRQNESCKIEESRHKKRCSECRFKKCLEIGLEFDKILNKIPIWPLTSSNDTTLQQVINAYSANFINRRRYAKKYFDLNTYINQLNKARSMDEHYRSVKIESLVMRDFLRNMKLIEFEEIGSPFETQICSNLWLIWLFVEVLFFTKSNGGHRCNKLYTTDQSYLILNEDSVCKYYRENELIKDPEYITRLSMELFPKYLEVSASLANFDETEQIVLLFLMLQRIITVEMGPQARIQQLSNQIFNDLKTHLKNNYGDVETKFYDFMLLIQQIEKLFNQQRELLIQIQLSYKEYGKGLDVYAGKFSEPKVEY